MSGVLPERDPSPAKLEVLGVEDWPICHEPVAVQDKTYAHTETTFILCGRAEITPQGGQTVAVCAGDLVTFLPETRCRWQVVEALERRYRAG